MTTSIRSLFVLCVLCGCNQPMGNANSLAGDYDGDLAVDITGSSKTYSGTSTTPTTTTTINASSESRAPITIEAGYDSDGVLYGFPCVLPLKTSGSNLELKTETSCTVTSESTVGTGANNKSSEEKTYTFTDVTVKNVSSGKIKIEAAADYTSVEKTGANKTGDSDQHLEYEFTGTKVSAE